MLSIHGPVAPLDGGLGIPGGLFTIIQTHEASAEKGRSAHFTDEKNKA